VLIVFLLLLSTAQPPRIAVAYAGTRSACGHAAVAAEPYPGPGAHPIPGRIEAEDYDLGGEEVAYHDTTPGNDGTAYRGDDVDIEPTTDVEGGFNVGWTERGEWLSYSVDVAAAGLYDIQLRVASAMARTISETLEVAGPVSWTVPVTLKLHVELDGTDVSGPMAFVATAGWQNWTSVTARRVPLPAGEHTMRLAIEADGININWLAFSASPPPGWTAEERIEWIIAQMTVDEKIVQLHGSDWMDTADNTRLCLPGLKTADGPHGLRGGPSTSFPVGIAMAATWDPDFLLRVGMAMGREFRARGRNQALAPCADLNRDPRNGRGAESGGEDPYLAGAIGASLVQGIQTVQVIATVKHYAATNHQAGRRAADHKVDARTLRELYGMPFRVAVQQGGAWSVMSAYNWIDGRPSSANHELLTEVLRAEWAYPYFVVSDWVSVYGSAAEAMVAGCDVEMPHLGVYGPQLPDAIARGEVTMETLDRAVRRVLRAKSAAGLLDDSVPGNPLDICSPEHRELALEAAQKSIVLLKNEGGILPLHADRLRSIALIGPSANVARLDGTGSSVVEPCYAVTPRQGIAHHAPEITVRYAQGCETNGDDRSGFEAAIAAAASSDVVVFVGGLDETQEGEERDRVSGSVQLPGQQQALINELAAANPNMVVVLESGGVVALEHSIDNIKGLLYAFYPGIEGGTAIADVLFGRVNPGGKLPVSMPRSDDQLPAWDDLQFSGDVVDGFGYRRFDSLGVVPQFAFGHGLSYTTFEYGDLVVRPDRSGDGMPVLASVKVTNTGGVAGDEVVQLYLSARFADPRARRAVPMPVKQLRGFERTTLAPGQSEVVTFSLGPDELSFWSVSDDSFRVEAGTYTVRVGGASDNLPLSGSFALTRSVLYDSAHGETVPVHIPVLENVARGRPATCSSIEGPQYTCGRAVDGDLSTRWSSEFSDPQWIDVDLGAQMDVRRVVLHWENAFARAYRVQVSDDACQWAELYNTSSGDGEVDDLVVRGTGRFLRVQGTERGIPAGYSLWELEVYARPPAVYLPLVLDHTG
jgi:beta-glucosidase